MTEKEISTEEKILETASKVFTEKGFSGTRTRDIAEHAGINLALLNYYFRSKEKLFEQVMKAKILLLFGQILPIITIEKKKKKKTSVNCIEIYPFLCSIWRVIFF